MPEDASFYSSRILIVDDEAANLVLLERMLGRAGYTRLKTLEDSREVLATVRDLSPDLILLDLLMPYVDGYEILEQLRVERRDGSYLPIMVLTADVTPQALQRALGAGARDFLTKPFDQTELLLRVRNLLETRYLYLALQHQLEHLERISDETHQAISAMTHDISQPLAAVRLLTEALQQEAGADADELGKSLASDLHSIHAASEQMSDMIREVSDLNRMQTGRALVLSPAEVDIVALVREQVTTAARASKRRITLSTDLESLTGRWDGQRLTRVVSNLLSNAIKFSPKSSTVSVTLSHDDDMVQLLFADAGVGIPSADQPHVFEPYFRATNVEGKVEGSGLGLASSRQIVEQHNGSISVQSEEGRGSTFTVVLPLS